MLSDVSDSGCAAVINAETAAYQSDKFVTMARRTRQEYLRDLAANFLTDTTLEAPQKFCRWRSKLADGVGVELPLPFNGSSISTNC